MFHEHLNVIININGVCGVLLNLFLIYIILTDTKLLEHGYRTILLVIAVYNILYSFVHMVVKMRFLIDERGFVAFSEGLEHFGKPFSCFGILAYSFMFTQSLVLVTIHCTYRFVRITGKHKFLFKKWYWIASVFVGSSMFSFCFMTTCYYFFARSSERDQFSRESLRKFYSRNIDDVAYITGFYYWTDDQNVNHLNYGSIAGTVFCMSVELILYFTVCVVGVKLYYFVQHAAYSESVRSLQLQLLRLLLAQSIAPLIFEVVPVPLILFGGVTGIFPPNYARLIPIVFSAYAAFDALLILVLFKAYRRRCIRIFRFVFVRKKEKNNQQSKYTESL